MQKLIEEYRVLRDTCDVIIDTIIPILPLPENFEFDIFYRECAEWVSVELPLSLDAYRQFRSALGGAWEPELKHQDLDVRLEGKRLSGLRQLGKSLYICLKHIPTDIILDVNFYPNIAGATCKMVEVGTRKVSVYEMECGEQVV